MNKAHIYLPAIIFCIPLIWLAFQFDTALNADHAWLMEAANRLLSGNWMSDAYFDPNPPLSILLYVPSALIEKTGFIRAEYVHYTFTLICFGACIPILNMLLKCFDKIDSQARLILLFCFVCANTVLTSSGELYFGERDHFIFMGLCVFGLYQLLITYKNIYRFEYIFMAVAVLFILLKPHFLIIPALFLVHRMIQTKNIKESLYQPDVFTLIGVSGVYLLITLIFFWDYVFEIFPTFRAVYLTTQNQMTMQIGLMFSSIIVASFILSIMTGLKMDKLKNPLILFSLSLLCCALFWVQMKGIYYQLIPAVGFWVCGFGLLLYNFSKHYLKDKPFITPAIMMIVLVASFIFIPPKTALSHAEYKQTPLYSVLDKCDGDCSFYMFTDSMDVIHQLAFYSGTEHASRFPVLWWLPSALEDRHGAFSKKFRSYVIEDLKKYEPDYLIIAQNVGIEGQEFSLTDYLSDHVEFNIIIRNYGLKNEMLDNRSKYFRPNAKNQDLPLTLEVYKRQ